ncbi:branched-chain amino acid ABC transporter permease [Comamonas thiooxydans]|uniref:branched-chain amino acid ABC transporter permease n=1 Tax=Comamonas thiooxydans TaxID=363952 RepID=UPI00209BF2E6|nr:branched-chain amino acid ABC transporter permease [Comamonas thiooxydans]MCO8251170.1 branched-chain amino acid ABC transporter permease [Comamonas thiooxydans]
MSESVQVFAQLTANGITVGAIYALVALGVVLIYKATEVLNFAHGDLLVIAAFSAWGLITVMGLPFWLAILITVAITALIAYGLDAFVIRRIAGQPQFAGVMLTIALAFMIRGLVSMLFGPESRNYPTPWTNSTTSIGGLQIADLQLVILGMAMAVTVVLYFFFRHTRLGIAMQAASQNQLAAYLNGVRVKRVNSLVWALAGSIAALAGVLLAPITLVDTTLWLVTLKALAALVLGGFGSIPGAIVGGLLIGLVEQYAGVYMPQGTKDIVAYLVLIFVLIFRPHGLLGEAHGRRV